MLNRELQLNLIELQKEIPLLRYLACYDFRVEMKTISRKIGLSERVLFKKIASFRELPRNVKSHIGDLRWFRLRLLLVFLKGNNVDKIVTLRSTSLTIGKYLKNVKVLHPSPSSTFNIVATFLAPQHAVDKFNREVELILNKLGYSKWHCTLCDAIPIYTCPFVEDKVGITHGDIQYWEEQGFCKALNIVNQALNKLGNPKYIDIVLFNVLTFDPFAHFYEVFNVEVAKRITHVKKALKYPLSWIRNRYRSLSESFILGRVSVNTSGSVPILLRMDASHAPLVHAILSYCMYTPNIFICDDGRTYVLTPLTYEVTSLLKEHIKSFEVLGVVSGGYKFMLPDELWDDTNARWIF